VGKNLENPRFSWLSVICNAPHRSLRRRFTNTNDERSVARGSEVKNDLSIVSLFVLRAQSSRAAEQSVLSLQSVIDD